MSKKEIAVLFGMFFIMALIATLVLVSSGIGCTGTGASSTSQGQKVRDGVLANNVRSGTITVEATQPGTNTATINFPYGGSVVAVASALDIITQDSFTIKTESSGTGTATTRLTISGSVAASSNAEVTWTDAVQMDLVAGNTLNMNTFAMTFTEMAYAGGTAPANTAYLVCDDIGGKTQLIWVTNSGTSQVAVGP